MAAKDNWNEGTGVRSRVAWKSRPHSKTQDRILGIWKNVHRGALREVKVERRQLRVIWLYALDIQYFPFRRLSEIARKNASETSVEHQPGRGNIQYERGAKAIKVVLTSVSQPLTLTSHVETRTQIPHYDHLVQLLTPCLRGESQSLTLLIDSFENLASFGEAYEIRKPPNIIRLNTYEHESRWLLCVCALGDTMHDAWSHPE